MSLSTFSILDRNVVVIAKKFNVIKISLVGDVWPLSTDGGAGKNSIYFVDYYNVPPSKGETT